MVGVDWEVQGRKVAEGFEFSEQGMRNDVCVRGSPLIENGLEGIWTPGHTERQTDTKNS